MASAGARVTRILRAVLGLLLALGAPGCNDSEARGLRAVQEAPRVNAPEHLQSPYLVLVSFDGFRHDYLDLFDAPNFRRVERAGVRADGLIPVYPSVTFPNHYSIATGMYPGSHGIVANVFRDPERGEVYNYRDRTSVEDGSWYGGEPIWVTAERQGMVAAAYFFVGTEADVGGVRPSYWYRFDGSVPNDVRVDRVLRWLSMPEPERPHMITLYFSDVDGAGHRYGAAADPQVRQAIGRVDSSLGRLLDGIEALPHGDRVYVVLVSDHGMAPADGTHYRLGDYVGLSGVRLTGSGTHAEIWVDGGPERVATLGDTLSAAIPGVGFYRPEDAPAGLHTRGNPRFGDLMAVPDPGNTVGTGGPPGRGGHHGWAPSHPDMRGIFLALGPGIGAGTRIPAFENVHIYPFMARVLGLRPNPEIDGDPSVLAGLGPPS